MVASKFIREFAGFLNMHSDEEVKDGRYFPSQQEQAILTQTIDQYFQLPERSEERALCVQKVTAQLAEINPRWTNRSVRLWFNNNKRTCLKQNSVQFDPSQVRATPLTIEQMPPKKRPPRSASVGANIGMGYPGRQPSPMAADLYYGDHFAPVYERLQLDQTDEEKKEIENDLNKRLIDFENRLWAENIGASPATVQLTARGSISGFLNEKSPKARVSPPEVHEYGLIDCATFVGDSRNRVPAVISEGRLYLGPGEAGATEIEFRFPPAAVAFDRYTSSLFIVSGKAVVPVSCADRVVGTPIDLGSGAILRSTIAVWPDCVAVGAKSRIVMFGRDISTPLQALESGLHSITSLAAVGSFMAVASRNHHAIHILERSGTVRAPSHWCLGHGAGVTCLSSANEWLLLSGSADKTARLWDIRTNAPVIQMQRHLGPLTVVQDCWYQGRQYAITGSEDHRVRVWDLRMHEFDLLLETDVGAGVPVAVELGDGGSGDPGVLMVVTKEKDTTTADGIDYGRNNDTRAVVETNPNLAIRFQFEYR